MNLANRITVSRIILVPLFIASLLYLSPERSYLRLLAIAIFLTACGTDALDGWLARRRRETTELGSYIDPIADKLLLLSGFLSLSWMPQLPDEMRMPAWVTIAVISRDFLIVVGSMLVFLTTGALKAKPIYIGKITTVVQMATLLAALSGAPRPLCLFLNTLTVFYTLWSGILYVRMGGLMLQEEDRG